MNQSVSVEATPLLHPAVSVLELSLHDQRIGHLVWMARGGSALVFDEQYRRDPHRATLTLGTHPSHPHSARLLSQPWLRASGLHPLLANLLPEAGLRAWLSPQLPADALADEAALLCALGDALPGALRARALSIDAIPPGVLDFNANAIDASVDKPAANGTVSLAGSQLKLAMNAVDATWALAQADEPSRWILKLPSAATDGLPQNEFSALQLAKLAGVCVAESRLLSLASLPVPAAATTAGSEWALAVRRFDRQETGTRIHSEDFAQVLFKAPHEKYSCVDASVLGKIVHGFTASPQSNTLQLAQRLLVNVLLGNGDAHLKNWSLLYPDRHHAQLAPAYDLQCSQMQPEAQQHRWAIGGCSDWYALELSHFETWSRALGLPWRTLRPVLKDTIERARTLWPAALDELPMLETHKLLLRHHWKSLSKKLQYGL